MKHITNNLEIYQYFRSLSKVQLQKELESRIQKTFRLEEKVQYLNTILEKMEQSE